MKLTFFAEPGGLCECEASAMQPEQGLWLRMPNPSCGLLFYRRVRNQTHHDFTGGGFMHQWVFEGVLMCCDVPNEK